MADSASPNDHILEVPLPDPSPPSASASASPPKDDEGLKLESIIEMMVEQELGKLMLSIAVAVTAAVLMNDDNPLELFVSHFIQCGLMMGFMAIWNGILFRRASPRIANALELAGVMLVLLLLCALVASSLPKYFSCLLWLSASFSLAAFILPLISYLKRHWIG